MKSRMIVLENIKRKGICVAVFLFFCQYIFGQSEQLNDLNRSFTKYQQQYFQEKIFVHTDKAFYVSGEVLWFKIYNVDASSNNLLDLSKIAYVEIIDNNHKPILQAKVALKHGLGSGSFHLPFSGNSGNYILRAYTNWMKNFNPEIYFEKEITIVNTIKKPDLKPDQDSAKYSIRFFPEGGNMVYGIESKIAFKAENKEGRGVGFDGFLLNSRGDTVTRFHPLKFGIGNFVFTPLKGEHYKATIKTADNKLTNATLPDIYDKGIVMQIRDTSNNRISINVRSSVGFANQPCFLLIHNGKKILSAQMQYLENNQAIFTTGKDELAEGVSYFTIFDKDKQPVCERLYFRKPSMKLMVDARTDKDIYQTRNKVEINVTSAEMSGKPGEADMSISVYKIDSLQLADENNIVNYLSLTSCLQGKVESPGYYFQSNEADVATATDNLMLTHGWRRFRWENILDDKKPFFEFAPEKEGHIITGKVINKNSGIPGSGISTYLSVPAKKFILAAATSNEDGTVYFELKDFFGSGEMVVQTTNAADSNYRIDISNPFSDKFSSVRLPDFFLARSTANLLTTHSIASQVRNVYENQGMQKFYSHETGDSSVFYGKPDQKYFLDDYTRFTTMEEVMREYVANIAVRQHEGHFHIRVLHYPDMHPMENGPLLLIDGVPVSDADKIMAFDPLKIKKIELMNQRYFLGTASMDGIISYSTYNNDFGGFQFDPNVLILKYEGLQLQREFYSPVYDTKEKAESRLPDFRNVLFWSPEVNTGENGKTQLSFYTSDKKGNYIGVLQGITNDGKAGYSTFRFTVN